MYIEDILKYFWQGKDQLEFTRKWLKIYKRNFKPFSYYF